MAIAVSRVFWVVIPPLSGLPGTRIAFFITLIITDENLLKYSKYVKNSCYQ